MVEDTDSCIQGAGFALKGILRLRYPLAFAPITGISVPAGWLSNASPIIAMSYLAKTTEEAATPCNLDT